MTDSTVGAAVWAAVTGGGAGDMTAAVYDPTAIAADAFARGNHTGTQAASTISDFGTEVANNTDVAANTTHRGTVTGNPHAVSGDELNSDAQPAGKIIETDGAGGFVYLDTPSGGGSAGGSNRQVQFNDSGNFGADSGFQINTNNGLALTYRNPTQTNFQQYSEGRGCLQVGAVLGTYGTGNNRKIGDDGTNARGSLTVGCINSQANNDAKIRARERGAFAGGYLGTTAGYKYGAHRITGQGKGAIAFGCVFLNAGAYADIEAKDDGSMAVGYILNEGKLYSGNNSGAGIGSFALGMVDGSAAARKIETLGRGAFGMGHAKDGDIVASGNGAFAFGQSEYGAISATANGAVMINSGANGVAHSVKFGGAGYGGEIHILGGSQYSDPVSPVNGQMWATYNFYYATHAIKARVNGVTKDFTNIP